MQDFGFARAAFAGFDLLRRRPVAVLALMLVGTLISFSGRTMSIVSTHLQLFGQMSPFLRGALLTVVMIVASAGAVAIIGAAVARLAVKPNTRSPGLRLGGDEARLFLLAWLVLPGLLVVLAAVAIGAAIGVATGAPAPMQDGIMSTSAAVGGIALFGLASRLWPAGVMTLETGALRLRVAWRMTGKRPWKIFALFCLVTGAALLIGIGGNIILTNVLGKLPALQWSAYQPLEEALKSGFRPAQLGHLLLQGLLFGAAIVLQAAPATVILDTLAEDRASDQAAVFD